MSTKPPFLKPTVSKTVAGRLVRKLRKFVQRLSSAERVQIVQPKVHKTIRKLEQEIVQLQDRIEVLQAECDAALTELRVTQEALDDAATISRPSTPRSVDQIRFDLQAAADTEFLSLQQVSSTIEKIRDLPPEWAFAKLQQDRGPQAEQSDLRGSQLDCWMRSRDRNHEYGYTKINLRNSFQPHVPGVRIGCQPFRHQLAVVAAGYGQNLLRTSGVDARDEVSHLCLNARCFNPEHVLVECQVMNRKRWACGGAWAIKMPGGSVYHPCPHGQEAHRKSCLLPRYEVLHDGYFQNTPWGPVCMRETKRAKR